jgi:hypothetical protein
MIVYIYDNGLCDPVKQIGTARQFDNIRDVDAFIKFFVASMSTKVIRWARFRIFVTDNDVGFMDMDHWVLMNEQLTVGSKKAIEEIDITMLAYDCNDKFKEQEDNLARKRSQYKDGRPRKILEG